LIDQITAFLSTSHELTPLSFSLLALVFIASGLILLPRILLCVLAGAAYGLVAIPIAVPATALGALLAFLVARYLAADFVQRLIARRRLLQGISRAVDREGWRIIALMRLGAPVPGAFSNYLFGLTNIGWWPYTWSTFVFCIPQVVLFVSIGAAGRAAVLKDSSIVGQSMIALGVVTCAAIVYLVARRSQSTFAELDGTNDDAVANGPAKN
jgi:uncharacterized membrane protein YdjX (TVP38/TMEM64 family)